MVLIKHYNIIIIIMLLSLPVYIILCNSLATEPPEKDKVYNITINPEKQTIKKSGTTVNVGVGTSVSVVVERKTFFGYITDKPNRSIYLAGLLTLPDYVSGIDFRGIHTVYLYTTILLLVIFSLMKIKKEVKFKWK